MKKLVSYVLILVIAIGVFSGCGKKESLIIGHKNYTEARVLGQMFALLIENNTEYEVEVKEFGGTNIALEALKTDEIIAYPEYTGTAYGAILKQSELKDPQKVYDYVSEKYLEEYGIKWLEPLGYNNTYTLALKREKVEELGIKTFSDLIEYAPELTLGATTEFIERDDGMVGLKKEYTGLEFKDELSLDPGLRYTAIKDDKIDVMDAFSTDGQIKAIDLTILEDDKNFFPPYYVAPIMKDNFAKDHPEVVDALNLLANSVTEEEMQELNYLVDEKKLPEKKVAEDFLKEKGIIK